MNVTPRKQSWAAVAVLTMATILFATSPQLRAATSGEQLTKKQVKALTATARTSEDHQKLAEYYNLAADRLEADAKEHEELAQTYRLHPSTLAGKGNPQSRTFGHCDAIAKSLHNAAKSSRELAAEHEQMARDAAK